MSDTDAFATGMQAILTGGDATFAAALSALIGASVTNVLSSNLMLSAVPDSDLPCFVIEQGDGAPAVPTNGAGYSQTIGLSQKTFISELYVVLIWVDDDRENAAATRRKLPKLFAQLMLRNPQPGGVDSADFAGWQPDRGMNHPRQVWRAVIAGEYTITKS